MTDWTDLAACRGVDVAVFYADGVAGRTPNGRTRPDPYAEARRICTGCDVTTQCLDYAMTVESGARNGRHGFWGGLNPDQRAELARGRRRTA